MVTSNLSPRKSVTISLWLLLPAFLIFIHRLLQDIFDLPAAPDTLWPFWLRLSVKSIILIVIPFAVAIINFKAKPLTTLNVIIAVISASVALLFTIVQITDY